jgi:hypothetical protein
LTKERFNLVRDYFRVRKQKDDILRYKSVSQYINPKEWNIYDILETVSLSKIREVYDKYYILMISIYQMIKKSLK